MKCIPTVTSVDIAGSPTTTALLWNSLALDRRWLQDSPLVVAMRCEFHTQFVGLWSINSFGLAHDIPSWDRWSPLPPIPVPYHNSISHGNPNQSNLSVMNQRLGSLLQRRCLCSPNPSCVYDFQTFHSSTQFARGGKPGSSLHLSLLSVPCSQNALQIFVSWSSPVSLRRIWARVPPTLNYVLVWVRDHHSQFLPICPSFLNGRWSGVLDTIPLLLTDQVLTNI